VARRRSRQNETDRRHSCNVFPASSRFPAMTCPPAGSEETDMSPTGGGRPADIGSINRNSATSFVYNGHEARTMLTTIVYACTHARMQHDRLNVARRTMMPFSRRDAPCRLNVRATSIGNLEEILSFIRISSSILHYPILLRILPWWMK